MGSYIGGTINYVAICEALGMSPSVMAAGVAADNVICAIYFIALFSLASKIPSEASTSSGGKYYLGHKNIMRCLIYCSSHLYAFPLT